MSKRKVLKITPILIVLNVLILLFIVGFYTTRLIKYYIAENGGFGEDDAIGGRQQMTGGDLRTQVCQLCNIRSWKFYNSLLEQAINDSVLMKSYDHAGHVIYALKPQAPVQTELYQDVAPF